MLLRSKVVVYNRIGSYSQLPKKPFNKLNFENLINDYGQKKYQNDTAKVYIVQHLLNIASKKTINQLPFQEGGCLNAMCSLCSCINRV